MRPSAQKQTGATQTRTSHTHHAFLSYVLKSIGNQSNQCFYGPFNAKGPVTNSGMHGQPCSDPRLHTPSHFSLTRPTEDYGYIKPCVQIRYGNKQLIAKLSSTISVAMHGVCVRVCVSDAVVVCMNKHDV